MSGPAALRALHGVFAVYKPAGVASHHLCAALQTQLLLELNGLEQPGPPQLVRVETVTTATEQSESRGLTVTMVPSLADHPLVRGPRYRSLGLAVGHGLDIHSSGILVLAVGSGRPLLQELRRSPVTRAYTLHGRLGVATEDFSIQGRPIDTVTYDHVTRELMERAVAMMHGTAQKALLLHSDVDVGSHEAYLRAASGRLVPRHDTPPLVTAVRLADFNPPAFTLEVQCVHEDQLTLRRCVHELCQELRSAGAVTLARRVRDGPLGLPHAVPRGSWGLRSVTAAARDGARRVRAALVEGTGAAERAGRADQDLVGI